MTLDADYFRARAIEERDRATKATSQNIADIHGELAMKYEALARQADLHPTMWVGWDGMSDVHSS
jgi:hypothetical protein